MPAKKVELPRLATDTELKRLKSVTKEAVKLSSGREFADRTRVLPQVISKYGSDSEPGHFIPFDVAVELDRHNNAPLLIATAAGMLGYCLVPTDEMEAAELCLSDAQNIAKESGDVINLLLTLLTSGQSLAAADRSDLFREVTELKAALYRLVAKIHGGNGG